MSILFGRSRQTERTERIVTDLVREIATLRERIADLESERAAAERLAGEVRTLGQRLDMELDKVGTLAGEVVDLDRKVEEGQERTEAQRLKLVALAKSVDWETDSLRKSLETVVARGIAGGETAEGSGQITRMRPPAAQA